MRILMLEDQEYFASLIKGQLEGFSVTVVNTLAEAKSALNTQSFDIMLVDLGLPDSQGIDTLKSLSKYKIPKVVLTGRSDISKEVAQFGAIDYVVKNDIVDIYERVMFNVAKIQKAKRPRFAPEVFGEIRACFAREKVGELTYA
jgi:DNA-binding response OmpR family regulator